ncbi:MAG TPA: recombinase RecT [Brachyspira hyodysenteriae]|nr:recombinase RecT [Brachyspira hyodysenteriae]
MDNKTNKDTKKELIKSNNQNIVRVYQLSDISRMADYIAEAKMFGIKSKAEAFILLMVAENEGINPIQASMDYDIINGKPTIKTVAALRRFLEAGGQVKYKVYTDTECTVEVSHKQYGSIEVTWTIEKANKIIDYYDKQTGKPHYLTEKMNWKNYPRDMLKHRAVGEALRTIYPQGMKNMYTTEEASDFSKDGSLNNVVDIQTESIITNDIDGSNYNQNKDVFENRYNHSPYKQYEDQTWDEMETSLLLWHINNSTMKNTHPGNYKEAVAELKRRNIQSSKEENKEKKTESKPSASNKKEDKKIENDKKEEILQGREYDQLELKDLKKLVLIETDQIILKVIYDLIEKKLSELEIKDLIEAREYYTNKKPNEKLLNIVIEVLNEKLSVCPVGISKGMKWSEMSTDKLNKYLSDYQNGVLTEYTSEYIGVIGAELLSRESFENNIEVLQEESKEKQTEKPKTKKEEKKKVESSAEVHVDEDEDPFSDAYDDDWGGDYNDLLEEQEEREKNPPHQINDGLDEEDDGFKF